MSVAMLQNMDQWVLSSWQTIKVTKSNHKGIKIKTLKSKNPRLDLNLQFFNNLRKTKLEKKRRKTIITTVKTVIKIKVPNKALPQLVELTLWRLESQAKNKKRIKSNWIKTWALLNITIIIKKVTIQTLVWSCQKISYNLDNLYINNYS